LNTEKSPFFGDGRRDFAGSCSTTFEGEKGQDPVHHRMKRAIVLLLRNRRRGGPSGSFPLSIPPRKKHVGLSPHQKKEEKQENQGPLFSRKAEVEKRPRSIPRGWPVEKLRMTPCHIAKGGGRGGDALTKRGGEGKGLFPGEGERWKRSSLSLIQKKEKFPPILTSGRGDWATTC